MYSACMFGRDREDEKNWGDCRETLRCSGFRTQGEVLPVEELDQCLCARYGDLAFVAADPAGGSFAWLREIRDTRKCSCVVLVGTFEPEDMERALMMGAFDILPELRPGAGLSRLLLRVKSYLDETRSSLVHLEREGEMLCEMMLQSIDEGDERPQERFQAFLEHMETVSFRDLPLMQSNLHMVLQVFICELGRAMPWLSLYLDLPGLYGAEICGARSTGEYRIMAAARLCAVREEIRRFCVPRSAGELTGGVCRYILENVEDPVMSLAEAARKFYVNKSYLSYIFSSEVGVSFISFLTFARMERAKMLLRLGGKRINQIARCLGYRDVEYFGCVFKKRVGMIPSEFRRICRAEAEGKAMGRDGREQAVH